MSFTRKGFIQVLCFCLIMAQAYCEPEKLTPAFLVETGNPIDLVKYPIGSTPKTFLINASNPEYENMISNIKEDHIPVVIGADQSQIKFDLTSYFGQLNTTYFGRNLIFGDVVTSNMAIARDFPTIHGLVIISNMHTKGKGSSNTVWESPRGDIYLNFNLQLSDPSRSALLPAYCAISLLKAVESTPFANYSKLPIKFSWPISLVWMPWGKKIGGVLYEKLISNETHNWYSTGCGLRVNSELQYSVSKMIDEYNAKNPNDRLEQLNLSKLIARTVNYLEEYFPIFDSNPDEFTKLVKENWVNYKQKVVVNVNSKIVDLKNDGSIELSDGMGFTAFLQPIADRFDFEPKQLIN